MISGGVLDSDDKFPSHLDILINAAGCEQRSSALVRRQAVIADNIICIRFPANGNSIALSNQELMSSLGGQLIDDFDTYFRSQFISKMYAISSTRGEPISVGLDVSSMNRTMIATVAVAIASCADCVRRMTLFYLPAAFSNPNLDFPVTQKVGPVIPELLGFDLDPRLPFALAMGVGYEYGVGVGLISQIEPRFALCLRAVGIDKRFESAVRQANLDFEFGPDCEIGEYNILDPVGTFQMLDDICYGLSKENRLVIVPLGPKIFAALSILCGIKYFGTVAVWRVVSKTEVYDAVAAGPIAHFSVEMNDLKLEKNIEKIRNTFVKDNNISSDR